ILNIIEKHATIKDSKALSMDLQEHFKPQIEGLNNTIYKENLKMNLNDLITPNTITLKDSVLSWEDAIRIASSPLIKNGDITEDYLKTMQETNWDPYIVISPNTAIPHASPEKGVKKTSMSLLRIKEGVKYVKDLTINLVIVIAAVDKEQHIRALSQLMKLTAEESERNSIIKSQSIGEINEIIKEFCYKMERS